MSRRVVVTGMGIVSPIGNSCEDVTQGLRDRRSGIVTMPQWGAYQGINTRLAGVVDIAFDYPRKRVRTMGRVSMLAFHATEQALAAARLPTGCLTGGRAGVAYGSTHGSSSAMEEALSRLFGGERTFSGMASSSYFKFMSHTAAANLAVALGVRGRVYTTCSACTSGSQAIGYGYEAIAAGQQDVMLCGGAEEMHVIHAAVFDVMYATSTRYNERPSASPRPYDRARDGLVVGEGAATLVLESLEHARDRGATIYGEIIGYGTNCDGMHAAAPSVEGMVDAMKLALACAGLDPGRIDYVNGHGTATDAGDLAESQATRRVFDRAVPISSTKSYTGHTLGACGAIESVFCLQAMREGFLPPTRTLDDIDERCADLDYVRDLRLGRLQVVMNNNFAFGGINTSLIFAAYEHP